MKAASDKQPLSTGTKSVPQIVAQIQLIFILLPPALLLQGQDINLYGEKKGRNASQGADKQPLLTQRGDNQLHIADSNDKKIYIFS